MYAVLLQIDARLTALLKVVPGSWYSLISLFTWLGSPIVIIGLAVVGAGVAGLMHAPRMAFALLLPIVALGSNGILKLIFRRDRPETIYVEDMIVHSYSFPSGHAFGAAVLYGLLAYIALTRLPGIYGVVAAAVLLLLIGLIGISRVYLGAHFPSDVIVGWLLGGIAAVLIIRIMHI